MRVIVTRPLGFVKLYFRGLNDMSLLRRRLWHTPHNPRTRSYDVEFSDPWSAMMFMKVVKIHDKQPCVISDIVPKIEGSSTIKFWATVDERIITEYIYRRYVGLEPKNLMDQESYQNNAKKWMEEGYVIY